MKKWAYYNDVDPAACAVTRELIKHGVICDGVVDARSIKDINPDDIRSYTQAHFFCGGSLWSVAARLAGWPDDKPLWTASCPCQPFSQAGKQRGVADERHLWPDLFRLVRAVRPRIVVGEQVSGAAGYAWLDGVRADLASEGYTCRAYDIPACAVDAPHIRNRLYWCAMRDVADANQPFGRIGNEQPTGQFTIDEQDARAALRAGSRHESFWSGAEWIVCHDGKARRTQPELRSGRHAAAVADAPGDVGDSGGQRCAQALGSACDSDAAHRQGSTNRAERFCLINGTCGDVADTDHDGQPTWERDDQATRYGHSSGAAHGGNGQSFWSGAEWIVCHDGKARRTKSRLCDVADGVSRSLGGGSDFGALTPEEKEAVTKVLSPDLLVDALPSRVDLWRITGNAIVPEIAASFLAAIMETLDTPSI